ncbi:TonB-dependent receptor [Carboxylicivirga mesophila]|uniref:TonB-dependent receptor n=1 Tax=Carboxylicivirga mesophila TaxID=1166478 RepID=A0ABS5K830_9BACT|nr:TonB-dependent receptor [Carboxylicivirga mesophila]MBS2211161.1 TonB-dependent receptor [Carboxylicivirga mesophila]
MKNRFRLLIIFVSLLISHTLTAQTGTIKGLVKDKYNNQPIPFVNIVVYGTTTGTMTDSIGRFELQNVPAGFVQLQLSSIGYKPFVTEEFNISQVRNNYFEIALETTAEALDEVQVTASPYAVKPEAPVSLRRIGIDQIEKSAGANRDISKVLQSFPGVGSASTFRNDLFVRGGGPSENRFFIDGIEIPTLNHFTTQGASGGPVGILNVDFIREVDFYSSAFPVSKGNALSSVFEFKQIDVQDDKPHFKGTVGASELSLTTTAPISEKTGLIASVRRSYLQFLFDALELPFLPTFTDFQFKTQTRIDAKNEITFLGVGAIDRFKLNLDAEPTEENNYILDYLPVNNQWSYTVGAAYKHFFERSYLSVFMSRNHLNNVAYKYKDNIETPENLLTDYSSDEIENKLRVEYTARPNDFTINIGAGTEYVQYQNETYNKVFEDGVPKEINYSSELDFIKWSVFGSVSHPFFNDRLTLSAGLRMDANSYSSQMNNLFSQISPRVTASYMLLPDIYLNMNVGRYYQNPAYTTLGYRNNAGELVNKSNGIKYLQADHVVGGLEYRPNKRTRITLEGFFKQYDDYPFSVKDSISMASKGGDFGIFGDEEVTSTSKGKSYGAELLFRTRTDKGFSMIGAYTFVRSEFTDWKNDYVPSSWDSRHILTFTGNKDVGKNWNIGVKWRFVGGLPYTPYDYDKSSLVLAWDAQNRQYLDYSQFNTQRLDNFHQLDLRIDKTWYLKNMTLGFYIDIQNLYNQKANQPPELIQELDDSGMPIIENPGVPIEEQRYRLKEIITTSGTVLPTIGLMIEF